MVWLSFQTMWVAFDTLVQHVVCLIKHVPISFSMFVIFVLCFLFVFPCGNSKLILWCAFLLFFNKATGVEGLFWFIVCFSFFLIPVGWLMARMSYTLKVRLYRTWKLFIYLLQHTVFTPDSVLSWIVSDCFVFNPYLMIHVLHVNHFSVRVTLLCMPLFICCIILEIIYMCDVKKKCLFICCHETFLCFLLASFLFCFLGQYKYYLENELMSSVVWISFFFLIYSFFVTRIL